jgi:hypothetical protein
MVLEQQLEDFKEQFLRTAPARRAALREAKIEELRMGTPPVAANSTAILLLWGRCSNHRTDPRLASLVRQQRTYQSFTVDLVSLRSSTPTRRCN